MTVIRVTARRVMRARRAERFETLGALALVNETARKPPATPQLDCQGAATPAHAPSTAARPLPGTQEGDRRPLTPAGGDQAG
ncbi:hypothetical protein [Nonomuraea angiospora]|uniref:hypothetical protein n=1 Tax=Nonomuraea angiospora TaxID=46172 RepID=UPI0029B1DEEC|nr:hypothetical protein [Nonomuraea angiospora]MDX3106932.1 hypothetical protein [Nonomuraea angiospora]